MTDSANISITVSENSFDIKTEIEALRTLSIGAITSFVGTVRDIDESLESLTLEHYPQMTEKCLRKIAVDACDKFDIGGVRIHHKVGTMKPMDDIVLVVCSSAHRGDSIMAVNYIMDYLKTDAPFWKSEITKNSKDTVWIKQRNTDLDARNKW